MTMHQIGYAVALVAAIADISFVAYLIWKVVRG